MTWQRDGDWARRGMGVELAGAMVERADFRLRTRVFGTRVMAYCRQPGASLVERFVREQLCQSATSVGANVEEAKGAQSKRDFLAKMFIALKEAREALYWLRVVAEQVGSSDPELDRLKDEANQLVAILTATVKTTRQRLADAENERKESTERRIRRRRPRD